MPYLALMRSGLWILICALALPLFASEPAKPSIPELTRAADLIIRGKVESKTVQRDETGRIFTSVRVLVQEVWKGDPKQQIITVVHSGGTLGERRLETIGQVSYAIDEEFVGFYQWNERGQAVTVGLAQGKLPYSPELKEAVR